MYILVPSARRMVSSYVALLRLAAEFQSCDSEAGHRDMRWTCARCVTVPTVIAMNSLTGTDSHSPRNLRHPSSIKLAGSVCVPRLAPPRYPTVSTCCVPVPTWRAGDLLHGQKRRLASRNLLHIKQFSAAPPSPLRRPSTPTILCCRCGYGRANTQFLPRLFIFFMRMFKALSPTSRSPLSRPELKQDLESAEEERRRGMKRSGDRPAQKISSSSSSY